MLQHQEHIGSERRVHQRFDDLRASLVQLGGNNNGIVLNISEGGMAVLFAEEVDMSTLRALRFQAPEFEHWMDINAEVAWISDSRRQAGIRFKGLSETTRTQLRAGISIAKTRAKRANQAKQAGGTTEGWQEVTDATQEAADPKQKAVDAIRAITTSIPASLASADSATSIAPESATGPSFAAPATSDLATPVAPESATASSSNATASTDVAPPPASESATVPSSATPAATDVATPLASESATVSNEAHTNSRPEKFIEDKGLGHSEARQHAPDARPEIETKEKSSSSEESKPDPRKHPLHSADPRPQKTSAVASANARSIPLALQKSAVAQMPSRSVFPTSPRKQPSPVPQGTSGSSDISYGKWIAVAAIAILASALAFLVGWILGDPSRIKLGH
jgi:PilZ domain